MIKGKKEKRLDKMASRNPLGMITPHFTPTTPTEIIVCTEDAIVRTIRVRNGHYLSRSSIILLKSRWPLRCRGSHPDVKVGFGAVILTFAFFQPASLVGGAF